MQNRCTNNSLLSHDKTISSLLELVDHVLSISEYVLEKQLLLILMKNIHKGGVPTRPFFEYREKKTDLGEKSP